MEQTDFWTRLVDTAYWQVLLSVIVVFTTSIATYFFANRLRRLKKLQQSISNIHSYSYLLQQVLSNRYQCEIDFNFYERALAINALNGAETPNSDFLEQLKLQTNKMPELSLQVSETYSKLINSLATIEMLASKKSYEKVQNQVEEVYNHGSFTIAEPSDIEQAEDLRDYLVSSKSALAAKITNDIKKPLRKLAKDLGTHIKLSLV